MDSGYITRPEHEEFRRRMEEEHGRQNKRIGWLEDSVRQMNSIAISVEKLALNMEGMLKEQERQGERIGKLEEVPAKKWNTVAKTVLTSAISAVSGGLVVGLVALLAQYIK